MRASILLGAAAWLAFCGMQPAHAQNGEEKGEELFQRALVMERASGQLREAMTLYEQIANEFDADHELAARALIRLGLAHEVLGNPAASQAYRRVLSDFADQTGLADQARTRLAALAAHAPEPAVDQATRLLLTDPDGCIIWSGMNPSPDGTRVVHTNMCTDGAVVIRNLSTGDTTVLASGAYHQSPVWSADGTRIATFRSGQIASLRLNQPQGGLRILDARTGADVTPDAVEGIRLIPRDWAGSHVTGVHVDGETRSTAVVSLATGRVVDLVGSVNQGSDFSSLSPDGRYVAFTDFDGDNQDVWVATVEGTQRRRITSGPERDFSPLWSPEGDMLLYRSGDGLRAVPMSDGAPGGASFGVRNEPLLPYDWTRNGLYYEVSNYVAQSTHLPVDPRTGERAGDEERLPAVVRGGDAVWMAWSPDMSTLAMADWAGVMRLYRRANGAVTEYPMGPEFLPSLLWWSTDGREVLFTTAARGRRDKRATVFALNPVDGDVRELFPRLDSIAHVHLSADGRKMTFIHNLLGQGPKEIRVTDTGSSRGVVLAAGGDGQGTFSGRFGQPIFSPDGSSVLFIRAPGQASGGPTRTLWIAPADGSEPARILVSLDQGFFVNVFWSPDGRNVAFVEVNMQTARGSVSVVSVDTGQRHEVLPFTFPRGGAEPEVELKYWTPDGRYLGITRMSGQLEFWVATDLLGQNAQGGGR